MNVNIEVWQALDLIGRLNITLGIARFGVHHDRFGYSVGYSRRRTNG